VAVCRGVRYLLAWLGFILFFHSSWRVSAQDLSVIGTTQEANDRIRSLGTSTKSSPHEYTIGSGDLLSISVFDVPELTRDLRVSQSGTIALPLVPTRLHVAGLTESQAEQVIADVLQANGLISHPEVGVMVKEHRSKPITIVGAVSHPMVYEADQSVTLLEALAQAGGIGNDAGDTVIVTHPHHTAFVMVPNPEPLESPAPGAAATVESHGESTANDRDPKTGTDQVFPPPPAASQTTAAPTNGDGGEPSSQSGNIITINLNELLEKGDMKNNIVLQAGDIVTVPHAGIVYVLGAVSRPGGFVLSNDRTQLTTMKVLALAGGATKIAKLNHAVIIRKDPQGNQTHTEIDLKKVLNQQSEDLQMRASDVLYIPDDRSKEVLYQALQIAVAVGTAVAIYRVAY